MKEEYVSYECAVKLKELGFDWECDHSYLHNAIDKSGNPYLYHVEMRNWNNFNSEVECFSAPRLDQAQKWLREKGIHISVNPYMSYDVDADGALYNEYPSWGFELMDVASADFMDDAEGKHDSYESALSAGIDKALELLTIKSNGK